MQTPVKSPAGEIRQTFWTRSPSPSRPNVTSGQSPSVTPRKSFWTRSPSPTRPPVTEQTFPGLPMTPKKSFWKGASSPTTTPKRRPKDELGLQNKKAQRIVDSFSNFQESVKNVQAFTRTDNDNAIAAKCIAKYGLDVFLVASNAIKHVPVMFLDRMKYISNIIREVNSQISDNEILDLVDAVSCIKFDMCVGDKSFKDVLWRASFKHGEPYMNFLVPQVAHCIASECGGNIYPAYISNVTLYKLTGPEPGLKCIMRCRTCSTRYNIDFYTIPNLGRKLYAGNLKPGLKTSSTWSYFSQDTFELMCESGNHAFVSHKAFADIYNSVFNEERDHEFYKWQNLYTSKPGPSHNEMSTETDDQELLYSCMSGKMAINAFITGELENELIERSLIEEITLTKTHTKEMVLKEIDDLRVKELYQHECSNLCKSKGCENLRVIDACWKLNMFHCLMAVPQKADGYPLLSLPNVCIREPKPGSVFCREHHELLTKHKIPVKKENFLKHVGCTATDTNKAVEKKVLNFANDLLAKDPNADVGLAAVEYQGTSSLVQKVNPLIWNGEDDVDSRCNKDIGLKGKLRQRSRGHFLCVTGGGHILYFNPLFKSESPSQVFLQTIKVVYEDVKTVSPENLEEYLENYFLAYDNMCHLDGLKCAREDLPLPSPYKSLWKLIKKVIDKLHLPNHVNPACKRKYNPDVLPTGYNTQAAEQTFSWLGRFKKIVNSMTQMHHLFYLHRMIKRRNLYTSKCRKHGKEPNLPQLRFEKAS